MARLKPLDLTETPDQFIALIKECFGEDIPTGYLPQSLMVMARDPVLAAKVLDLINYIMSKGRISLELKAMLGAVTSMRAGCMYCTAHTAHLASKTISHEKLDELWDFETSCLFSDKERTALKVALGAGAAPNEVSDADIEALRSHWSEHEIVEIISVISLLGFMNRWNDTLAIPLEELPANLASERLTDKGWTIGKHAS